MLIDPRRFRRLVRVRERLLANDETSVAELAEQFGFSSSRLIRLFTAVFGTTPHQLRTEARIERARELLGRGKDVTTVSKASKPYRWFPDASGCSRRCHTIFEKHRSRSVAIVLETLEDVFAIHNYATSWHEVDRETALACDAIAARALEEDPENESALWLYAQQDFLARVGRKRAPIPAPTIDQRIAKIERILALYIEDRVHPLDIPSLETIVIDHTAVLDALIVAFRRAPEGRARHAFIEALGTTLVDHEHVARLLVDELSNENDVDDICMAFHYGLKKRGKCARDRIASLAARLVAETREDDEDWRHLWPRTLGARLVFGEVPDWKRRKIEAA